MSLLALILVIVVVGVILWLINAFVPMDANVKKILNIVVIIVLIIYILKAMGVLAYLGNAHV